MNSEVDDGIHGTVGEMLGYLYHLPLYLLVYVHNAKRPLKSIDVPLIFANIRTTNIKGFTVARTW